MNTFFSGGFCFFSGDAEKDYSWAIERFNEPVLQNVLSQVFGDLPHILCLWHNQQNVLLRIKKTWRLADHSANSDGYRETLKTHNACMRDWMKAVNSNSAEGFRESWDYAEQQELFGYLEQYQLV
ncbi:hypothetical protein V8E54_008187 [Elaphomyces granulatus]